MYLYPSLLLMHYKGAQNVILMYYKNHYEGSFIVKDHLLFLDYNSVTLKSLLFERWVVDSRHCLLQVSCEGSLKNVILAHTLRVGVLPHSPGFPMLSLGCTLQITVRKFIEHTLDMCLLVCNSQAVLHRLSLCILFPTQAPEDCATKILPSGLSFVVTEMPSENYIYNITIPLAQEQGTKKCSFWRNNGQISMVATSALFFPEFS